MQVNNTHFVITAKTSPHFNTQLKKHRCVSLSGNLAMPRFLLATLLNAINPLAYLLLMLYILCSKANEHGPVFLGHNIGMQLLRFL